MDNKREIYADLIRTISIIFVLIIHTTCNYFVTSYGNKSFTYMLIISSLTAAAVPLFYAISGTFLINKKNIDYKKFYKKVVKIFLQTIFWTFIYLLIYKFVLNQNVNITKTMVKSIFSSQVVHLWFMYPLIALYIFTPFISRLYYAISDSEKRVLLLITLIIPAVLSTIQMKFWDIISIPKFAIIFPELGLFILGKYIYDNKEKLFSKKVKVLSFISAIISLLLVIGLSWLYIKHQGISNSKPYFDASKITILMLVASIYIFILSINDNLNKLPKNINQLICSIGKCTGGIYFIHMVFVEVFPDISIFGFHIGQNIYGISNMILGAFFYFIVSYIVVLLIKKIPILKRVV